MFPRLVCTSLLMGVLLIGNAALSQERQKIKIGDEIVIGRSAPTGNADQEKIRAARQFIREKNYHSASALLETVYEDQPTNRAVYQLLKNCYFQLSYFLKAEGLTRRIISVFPDNFLFRMHLAEILTQQGRNEEAVATYQNAFSLVDPRLPGNYEVIVKSMVANEHEQEALAIIESVRSKLNDQSLLAIQRGTILERSKNYREAAVEFLQTMNDSTHQAASAEKRLMSLLEFPESRLLAEEAMMSRTDSIGNARAFRVLSNYYLKTNQFDLAYDYAIRQDEAGDLKGLTLLNYIRICRDRKLYRQAARMAEYVADRYIDSPIIYRAYQIHAEVLTELKEFDKAEAIYDTIAAKSPHNVDKSDAVYRIGKIYLNQLHDPERALVLFDSVLATFRGGIGYLNAQLARPVCFLRAGDLTKARTEFERLKSKRLNQNKLEEIDFNLAQIHFFEKQTDSCALGLRKLIVDYPRGFYVNDALRLLAVITQAGGDEGLLYDYSNVLLFEERGIADSTVAHLTSLVMAENKALGDVATLKLARISLSRMDSTVAMIYLDKIAKDYPDSYYLPYALKNKADMLMNSPQTQEEAALIYRGLLQKFPNYPFISKVREILSGYEIDSKIG